MILVIGAGLTGLSAAYHLQDHEDVAVLEREEVPGGLCRSVTQDGFTFDLTGHLLHLRRPEIRRLVEDLIPAERFAAIDRKAFIWSHGVFTPYPFQVNTHGLPPGVVADCLVGFVEALRSGAVSDDEVAGLSFRQWVLRTFGEGIARHFMIPYNEKLWLTDLDEMTCDWVSWSIPRPSLREVVDGALGVSRKAFGYNPSFLYPREGGIRILPDALASRVRDVSYGVDVSSVDASRRTVTLRSGEEIPYDRLVSTLPLPRLVSLSRGLGPGVADAARRLRHVAVLNLNLGVAREIHADKHWVYFPGREFPFYRAGFPASFTPAAAPPGCSSIYLEVAVRPGEPWSEEDLLRRCREGLVRCGILREDDRILMHRTFYINPAYVVYDRHRRDALPGMHAALREKGIHSVGRYGSWYYNSMEDSIAEGRSLAAELLAGRDAEAGSAAAEGA